MSEAADGLNRWSELSAVADGPEDDYEKGVKYHAETFGVRYRGKILKIINDHKRQMDLLVYDF